MQPVSNSSKIIHVDSVNPDQNLKNYLTEAKNEPNLVAKRAHYETAFQIAKGRPKDDLLFRLFEQYAMETCYGQAGANGDEDEGFRKAAALLELSVVLQLTTMSTEWEKAQTLDELVASLGFARGTTGKYFQTVEGLAFDPRPSAILADTFIGLSFSYQNIDELTCDAPKFYPFHKKIDDFTNGLIGDDLEKKENFAYNRARFMAHQKDPHDKEAQITCYEPVLPLVHQAYKDNPLKRDSRLAQIENMIGIKSAADIDRAEGHFRKAFALREPLLGKFETDKENFDQLFLLCNVRCGLIHCLLAKKSVERLQEAAKHAQALGSFLQELARCNNEHSYSNGYREKIQAVVAAISGN